MEKFVSVIIPYYKEKKETIAPLLESINNQIGIDFNEIEVIMVNDGAHRVYPESFMKRFTHLDIKKIYMDENKGPGIARQIGIDAADGEYVMFCDADDCLHNVGAIGALIAFAREGYDFITSSWIEELMIEGKPQYIEHGYDLTWMHGKMIKRSLIQSNNISFHDDLRVHEDSYFLAICHDFANNVGHMNATTYVWKWGSDTITRRNNGEYAFTSMNIFNDAISKAIQWIAENGNPEKVPVRVFQVLCYNYFMAHSDAWNAPEVSGHLDNLNRSVVDSYKSLLPFISNLSEQEMREIYTQERNRETMRPIETETIVMWMERIGLV